MKSIKKIIVILIATISIAACSNSKKEDNATISDLKAKIEGEKKEAALHEASLKKLEAELLKLDTNTANAAKIKLVSIMPVTTQPFEHFIDLQGKVDAENISYISPRGMSGQVKALYIKQGQQVHKGQLLLKLDDAIVLQQITAAKKGLEGIKTQLAYAKNIYSRQQNLWNQGIGTEVQLITAKTNVVSLENQLQAAEENVKVAQEQLNTTNVYSDVSGIADVVNVKLGELFSGVAATGPQIKIVSNSNLKIVTNVPENYLTKLHTGTQVLITIPDANKQNIASVISLVGQSVDAATRGFLVEAKIASDPALKPNQTAIMRIKDYSAANALVIPVNMIQTDETGKYVFVMNKSSTGKAIAHRISVIIGEVYGNNVEIKSGLNGGEQLITEGYQSLYEGQAITTDLK